MDQWVLENINVCVNVQHWIDEDTPGYEHFDVTNDDVVLRAGADRGGEYDEQDKIDESQIEKCPISNSDAMTMFDGCLTNLRYQYKAKTYICDDFISKTTSWAGCLNRINPQKANLRHVIFLYGDL